MEQIFTLFHELAHMLFKTMLIQWKTAKMLLNNVIKEFTLRLNNADIS